MVQKAFVGMGYLFGALSKIKKLIKIIVPSNHMEKYNAIIDPEIKIKMVNISKIKKSITVILLVLEPLIMLSLLMT